MTTLTAEEIGTESQTHTLRCDREQNRDHHCGRLVTIPAVYMAVDTATGPALFVSAQGRCVCGATLAAGRRVR